MPEMFSIEYFGSVNQRDQSDALIARSHTQVQGGFRQAPNVPSESPYMLNVDYDPQGLRKRLGSTLYKSLISLLQSGETLLGGCEFLPANSGTRIQFIVGSKSFYSDQAISGTFVQLNTSASVVYTHAATASKFTVTFADGHLFIGLNGANQIQTYKYGADLDPAMLAGNLYENAYGAATNTITGTWATGTYLVASIHERLIFSDGQTLFEYTPMASTASSGIWDLIGVTAGAYHALGRIKFFATFVPQLRDSNEAILYIGTSKGLQMVTGFERETDRTLPVENAPEPLNHKAWCKTKNWIMYLTVTRDIAMVQGGTILTNIGARLKSPDESGFLDGMDISNSETNAIAFYNPEKEQALLFFNTASDTINDSCAVVDMKRGEPTPGMALAMIEDRVRLIPWTISNAASNDWFVFMYQSVNGPMGILSTGYIYTTESGRNDQGSIAITAKYRTPVFTTGAPFIFNQKQWRREHLRTQEVGDWPCTVKAYLDRSEEAEFSYTFQQVNTSTLIVGDAVVGDIFGSFGQVRKFHRTDRRAEAIQLEFSNENADQDFILSSVGFSYDVGQREVA